MIFPQQTNKQTLHNNLFTIDKGDETREGNSNDELR